MFSFKSITAFTIFAAAASAAPTATTSNHATRTHDLTGVTHSVTAGLGGTNTFSPDNIVAELGDIVEFHFLPANHTVAQSSFFNPCQPFTDPSAGHQTGFFAGFNFATSEPGVQDEDIFQIVVDDISRPIWFYCAQGQHCKGGMNGVINQNFDNQAFSLRAHRERAQAIEGTVIPSYVQGGQTLPNPNPNDGF